MRLRVYADRAKQFPATSTEIGLKVVDELIEMGLVAPEKLAQPGEIYHDFLYVPWANPVFDFAAAPALKTIWGWLETYGLYREADDLHPLTKWPEAPNPLPAGGSTVFMAGRFGQWKYFWSDDCVLRGRHLAASMNRGD
jgi:hypothetical protein